MVENRINYRIKILSNLFLQIGLFSNILLYFELSRYFLAKMETFLILFFFNFQIIIKLEICLAVLLQN